MLATLLASLVLCTGTTLARLAFSSPTADTVCIGNVVGAALGSARLELIRAPDLHH
jgi:phosphate/sulfate permease